MKTVIITGANRGIGLAAANLIKKKYNIIGIARKKIKIFQVNLLNVIYQIL